jgi:hypothetical protein
MYLYEFKTNQVPVGPLENGIVAFIGGEDYQRFGAKKSFLL